MSQYILETRSLTKMYSNGTVANKAIDFSLKAGEILGLVGENGAGKSTLMKQLYGAESPSSGKILIDGKEVEFHSSEDAIASGIGMVYQHFMLVPSLTLAENLVLGKEPKKKGNNFFDFDKAVEITEELSKKYNLNVHAKARVVDVSVSMRQKLEILKALYRGARVLILDEPSAMLTPQETEELFNELKVLKKQGYTIVFISHKLGEVFRLCDRVSVMRDGKMISTHNIQDVNHQVISNEMVGREVKLTINKEKAKPGKVVLEVRNISYVDDFGIRLVNDVSFSLRSGEILGVVGVDGNGQSELLKIISGLEKSLSGSVKVHGKEIINNSPRKIRQSGIAHVAEDRMSFGAALSASINDNLIADRYMTQKYTSQIGFLKKAEIAAFTKETIKNFDIRCGSGSQLVSSLSGGNMQKVVVGREFTADADILLVSQPSRGVDVGAIEFFHKRIIEMRDIGKAILLVSSDLTEVMSLSDSLIVMSNGQIVAYFSDAQSVTDKELGLYMLGLKNQDQETIYGVLHETKEQ